MMEDLNKEQQEIVGKYKAIHNELAKIQNTMDKLRARSAELFIELDKVRALENKSKENGKEKRI